MSKKQIIIWLMLWLGGTAYAGVALWAGINKYPIGLWMCLGPVSLVLFVLVGILAHEFVEDVFDGRA